MSDNDTYAVDLSTTSPTTAAGNLIFPSGGAHVPPSFDSCMVYAALTGATGGALDIYIQCSPDKGTTWVDKVHFAQKAAAAAATLHSFTLSKLTPTTTITTAGTGNTPALAANTVIGGDWGDRIRAVYVPGATTTAGTAQVLKLLFTHTGG